MNNSIHNFMKQKQIRSVKKIVRIGLLGALTFIAACAGESSDPLQGYNVKSGPVTTASSPTQTIAAPDLFKIEIAGSNQVNNGIFIEGQAGTATVKVTKKSSLITNFNLEITDFPNAVQPKLVPTGDPSVFSLQWTPPTGTIPAGDNNPVILQAQIRATAISNVATLNGLSETETLSLVVTRDNTKPTIAGHTDLSQGIDEGGAAVHFTVDVNDPASIATQQIPNLQILSYLWANTEAYRVDAEPYVHLDLDQRVNPAKIASGQWRFYYVIKVDQLPLDRDRVGNIIPSSSSVDMCFLIRAVGVLGTLSGPSGTQIEFKGRYMVQPPTMAWLDSSPKQLKSGVANTLQFKVSATHPSSQVSLQNASTQIAHLSGQKQISCQDEVAGQANSQICTLQWTPPCVAQDTSAKFSFTGTNTLFGKTKTNVFSGSLDVTANADSCPSATPPQTKPQGAK